VAKKLMVTQPHHMGDEVIQPGTLYDIRAALPDGISVREVDVDPDPPEPGWSQPEYSPGANPHNTGEPAPDAAEVLAAEDGEGDDEGDDEAGKPAAKPGGKTPDGAHGSASGHPPAKTDQGTSETARPAAGSQGPRGGTRPAGKA